MYIIKIKQQKTRDTDDSENIKKIIIKRQLACTWFKRNEYVQQCLFITHIYIYMLHICAVQSDMVAVENEMEILKKIFRNGDDNKKSS